MTTILGTMYHGWHEPLRKHLYGVANYNLRNVLFFWALRGELDSYIVSRANQINKTPSTTRVSPWWRRRKLDGRIRILLTSHLNFLPTLIVVLVLVPKTDTCRFRYVESETLYVGKTWECHDDTNVILQFSPATDGKTSTSATLDSACFVASRCYVSHLPSLVLFVFREGVVPSFPWHAKS